MALGHSIVRRLGRFFPSPIFLWRSYHLINILLAMHEDQKNKVLKAFQLVLRPIVKILLRYGIGYNEFAECVKTAYVDIGSSDFGIRGRPTNISRVAVMTGLTRKEVRRLRTKIEAGDDTLTVRTTPITEILTRWYSEPDFLDEGGRPLTLHFSEGTSSFSELVRRFGGDVPAGAMRTELKRMGLVDEKADRSLSVRSRLLRPKDNTVALLTSLVHGVYPFLATTARNTEPETTPGEGNPQFVTYSLSINEQDRSRVKRICRDRLSEAAVAFDDLFAAYDSSSDNRDARSEQPVVLVGLFYFEELDPSTTYKW